MYVLNDGVRSQQNEKLPISNDKFTLELHYVWFNGLQRKMHHIKKTGNACNMTHQCATEHILLINTRQNILRKLLIGFIQNIPFNTYECIVWEGNYSQTHTHRSSRFQNMSHFVTYFCTKIDNYILFVFREIYWWTIKVGIQSWKNSERRVYFWL